MYLNFDYLNKIFKTFYKKNKMERILMNGSKIIDGCIVWGLLDPQTIQNKWME